MRDNDFDLDLNDVAKDVSERGKTTDHEQIRRKAVGHPKQDAEHMQSAREELRRRRNEGGE